VDLSFMHVQESIRDQHDHDRHRMRIIDHQRLALLDERRTHATPARAAEAAAAAA
jgi:hypothetical protein